MLRAIPALAELAGETRDAARARGLERRRGRCSSRASAPSAGPAHRRRAGRRGLATAFPGGAAGAAYVRHDVQRGRPDSTAAGSAAGEAAAGGATAAGWRGRADRLLLVQLLGGPQPTHRRRRVRRRRRPRADRRLPAEQANTDPECRLVATVESLDAFWGELPAEAESPSPVVSSPGRGRDGCGRRRRRPGRSTARRDQDDLPRRSASSTTLQSRWRTAGRSPRCTSSRTSTATTSRTSTGAMAAADRAGTARLRLRAARAPGRLLRRDVGGRAAPRSTGPRVTFMEPITERSSPTRSPPRRRRRRPHPGGRQRAGRPRRGRTGRRAAQRWFTAGYERRARHGFWPRTCWTTGDATAVPPEQPGPPGEGTGTTGAESAAAPARAELRC